MTVEEILSLLTEVGVLKQGRINSRRLNSLTKQVEYEFLFEEIEKKTNFLFNNPSLAQRLFHLEKKIWSPIVCKICNNPVKFISRKQGYQEFCSAACAQKCSETREKRAQTCLTRHGSEIPCKNEEIEKKRRQTCYERYGKDFPFQSEEIQQRVRTSVQEKYGVVSTSLLPNVKQLQIETRRSSLGVDFPFQSDKIQEKVTQRFQSKYSCQRFSQIDIPQVVLKSLMDKEWLIEQHHIKKYTLTQIAEQLQVSITTVSNYFSKHNIEKKHYKHSLGEQQVFDFLNIELGMNVIGGDRSLIPPQEIDIIIPDKRFALEYNGLYYHCEFAGKGKWYHIKKQKAMETKGYRLIHLFEDEWISHSSLTKEKLSYLLGVSTLKTVYARKCKIVEISNQQRDRFLNEYHIQGTCSSTINFGLFYEEELLAVIACIIKKENRILINRYATSVRIPGGFSKLLTFLRKRFLGYIFETFADRRWSKGELYIQNGFILTKTLSPDYRYILKGQRIHKFNFRHKYLSKKLSHYDPSLSETENCQNHGISRIWDCGLLKFELQP